jgi:hypothetical protein
VPLTHFLHGLVAKENGIGGVRVGSHLSVLRSPHLGGLKLVLGEQDQMEPETSWQQKLCVECCPAVGGSSSVRGGQDQGTNQAAWLLQRPRGAHCIPGPRTYALFVILEMNRKG